MASAPAAAQPALAASFALLSLRPTFTQGLLVGQLSIVVLLLVLLRFLLFADPDASPSRRRQRGPIGRPEAWPSARSNGAATQPPPLRSAPRVPPKHLAERAGYDIGAHAPESTDWVNVLLALALHGYREDMAAHSEGGARAAVEQILNSAVEGKTAGTLLDRITVTSVDIGTAFPHLSDVRVRPSDEVGGLRIEAEIEYVDQIELSIETQLVVNYPRPRFAILPISLGLVIERLSGTISVELVSSASTPPDARSRHAVRLSLHPDFALDARASSQLGSRAKLVDVPKLEQILVERLRAAVHARLVWPRFVSLSLPDLVASALLPRVVAEAVTAAATASPPLPGMQPGETREQMLGRQASARAAGALGPGGGLFFEHPQALHAHARETGSSVSGSAFPPSASVAGGPSAARPGFTRAPSSVMRNMPLQHEPQHIPAVEAWRNHASAATGVELRAGADARQRNVR